MDEAFLLFIPISSVPLSPVFLSPAPLLIPDRCCRGPLLGGCGSPQRILPHDPEGAGGGTGGRGVQPFVLQV